MSAEVSTRLPAGQRAVRSGISASSRGATSYTVPSAGIRAAMAVSESLRDWRYSGVAV